MERTTCCDFAATELYHPAYMFGYATCHASCSSLCTDGCVKRELLPIGLLLLLLRLLCLLLAAAGCCCCCRLRLLCLLQAAAGCCCCCRLLLLCLLQAAAGCCCCCLLWLLLLVAPPFARAIARFLLRDQYRGDTRPMLLQDACRHLPVLAAHGIVTNNALKVANLLGG